VWAISTVLSTPNFTAECWVKVSGQGVGRVLGHKIEIGMHELIETKAIHLYRLNIQSIQYMSQGVVKASAQGVVKASAQGVVKASVNCFFYFPI